MLGLCCPWQRRPLSGPLADLHHSFPRSRCCSSPCKLTSVPLLTAALTPSPWRCWSSGDLHPRQEFQCKQKLHCCWFGYTFHVSGCFCFVFLIIISVWPSYYTCTCLSCRDKKLFGCQNNFLILSHWRQQTNVISKTDWLVLKCNVLTSDKQKTKENNLIDQTGLFLSFAFTSASKISVSLWPPPLKGQPSPGPWPHLQWHPQHRTELVISLSAVIKKVSLFSIQAFSSHICMCSESPLSMRAPPHYSPHTSYCGHITCLSWTAVRKASRESKRCWGCNKRDVSFANTFWVISMCTWTPPTHFQFSNCLV